MFAVPGWSVSADALRTQTGPNASQAATVQKSDHPISTDKKRSRKRKREDGSSNAIQVTDENLGDLWRRHIEEKSLDQPKSKKKGKKENQSNKRNNDALGEVESVDGGSFEGFSREDQTAGSIEEGAPPKKEKRKRKEHESAGTVKANGHGDAAGTSPLPKEQGEAKDGKSKYEQRKAKILKKREERALLQANGTLPPSRPENISSHPTKNKPASLTRTATPSKSSQAPNALQEPDTTEPEKVSRAPEPPEPARAADATTSSTLSLPSTKLTPLQQRMAAKLTSARFRHLNQTLYTSPSHHAMRLFTDSPQNYTSYHAGFRAQVAVWPQNPVEGFISDIKTRATVSVPSQKKLWREQKKGKKKQPKGGNEDTAVGTPTTTTTTPGGEKLEALPRSSPNGICTIVDLGCGDATLAGTLSPSAKPLGLKLLSYDLAKGDTPHAHLVTVADISNLSAAGVRDETVDIAICCLSLMGTNWVDVVVECARIVRAGGEVWVAEIKSRFARSGMKNKKEKVESGVGRKKGVGGEEVEDTEAVALEEVEDARIKSGKKDETDVGAFVEVFRKRGMVLKGQPDMANKMFVGMRFVKGGLGAKKGGDENGGRRGGTFKKKTKFLDDDEVVHGNGDEDESKVLKPCVYKTR